MKISAQLVNTVSIFIVIILALLSYSTPVHAGTFQLKSIGALQTQGVLYDKWYYTGAQPTFYGEGLAGEEVAIIIDGESFTTTVNTNNEWSFTPAAPFPAGEHSLSFASAGSTIEFSLVIGIDIPEGVTAPEATSTPVAGGILPTLLVTSLGLSFLGTSFLIHKKSVLFTHTSHF